MIKDSEIKYSVGALMYSPASNKKIAKAVINEKIWKTILIGILLGGYHIR